jgi:hypothetical protein
MIEETLKQLTEALRENTAAIKQSQAQTVVVEPAPVKKTVLEPKANLKAPAKKPEVMPDPEPAEEEPTVEETPEPEPQEEETPVEVLTPTKVSAPTRQDDTPNVPSKGRNPDGSALAAEHVDVDEVISEINATVKGKFLKAGDQDAVEAMKTKWATIRKGYGVDRIADLRGNPSALLKALAQAKAL